MPIAGGHRYSKLIEDWLEENTPEPEFTPEELQKEAVSYFKNKTKAFLQERVDAYNTLYGLDFESVHNCESFSRHQGYTHQVWCGKVFTWSVNVWEVVRDYQDTLTVLPTDEEFQAVLDSVDF